MEPDEFFNSRMNSAQRVYQANIESLTADLNQAYIAADRKQGKLSDVQEQLEVQQTELKSY